jgi:hypothetical protein
MSGLVLPPTAGVADNLWCHRLDQRDGPHDVRYGSVGIVGSLPNCRKRVRPPPEALPSFCYVKPADSILAPLKRLGVRRHLVKLWVLIRTITTPVEPLAVRLHRIAELP